MKKSLVMLSMFLGLSIAAVALPATAQAKCYGYVYYEDAEINNQRVWVGGANCDDGGYIYQWGYGYTTVERFSDDAGGWDLIDYITGTSHAAGNRPNEK